MKCNCFNILTRIPSSLFWVVGISLSVVCGLVVYKGGPFEMGILKIGKVFPTLFLTALCLSAAYLLPDKGPPRKFRVANLCLLFGSLVFSGLVGELGLRYFLQKTQGFNSIQQLHNPNPVGNLHTSSMHPLLVITQFSTDKRLVYELKPHVDMLFGMNVLRTNSQGFRSDREFTTEKPAGVKRVIGVGDSGMWGWDADQNQGYMEIMERTLNTRENAPVVEMINLAVPGYNTFQELMALRLKGLGYRPDVVVIGWCVNDFNLPFFMYTRKDHWKQKQSYVYNLLFSRGRFLEMVTPEVLKIGDMPVGMVDPDVIAHSGEEGMRKTLETVLRLSEEHRFKIVLFGPLKDDIIKLCKETGMPMINTYDLAEMNQARECKVLFMHPLACGHEILGTFLAEKLQEFGWL